MKEWVRELVVVLVVAGLLEMLIPMGGMKRFVRMVVGLVVMLAILNPAFALLRQPLTLETALPMRPAAADSLPSLDDIFRRAAVFEGKNRDLVASEFRRRSEQEAAAAATVGGVEAAAVHVFLLADAAGGAPRITAVDLTVRRVGDAGEAALPGEIRSIEPVRLGKVSHAGDGGAVSAVTAPAAAEPAREGGTGRQAESDAAASDAAEGLLQEVRQRVAAHLGLHPRQVTVRLAASPAP